MDFGLGTFEVELLARFFLVRRDNLHVSLVFSRDQILNFCFALIPPMAKREHGGGSPVRTLRVEWQNIKSTYGL